MRKHTTARLMRSLVALCAMSMSLGMMIPSALAQDAQLNAESETVQDKTAQTDIEQDQNIRDGISLMLANNQYPTNGWLKFYQKDFATEIPSKQINVSSQSSYTMPNMSGVNGVDYHSGQGYSGNQDWMPIAWVSQNFDVGGQCDAAWSLSVCKITGGGSFGSKSSGVNKRFKPGAKVTPPTASGSSSWWAIYHQSWPLFSEVIRYNANGGTGSMAPTTPNVSGLDLNNANKSGVDVTLAQNQFTRPGYKFVGWESPVTGTVFQPGESRYLEIRDNPYNDKYAPVFKAKWQKLITVSYDGNGATGGSTASHANIGEGDTITIRQNGFTWPNHEFTGWNTKADGSGTSYRPNDKNAFKSNTTLYAQWKVLNATIHYDGNGATSGSVADQTDLIGAKVKAQQNGFTRDAYIFKQWNTKADGTGTVYEPNADITIPANGMTLYAIWTPVTTTMPSTGGAGLVLALAGGFAGLFACLAAMMVWRKRRA